MDGDNDGIACENLPNCIQAGPHLHLSSIPFATETVQSSSNTDADALAEDGCSSADNRREEILVAERVAPELSVFYPEGDDVMKRHSAATVVLGALLAFPAHGQTFLPPLDHVSLELPSCGLRQPQKVLPIDPGSIIQFALSVDVSPGRVIIGSPLEDGTGTDTGSAYIYELLGHNWKLMKKLVVPGGAQFDDFGSSVAIDGDVAVIGSQHGTSSLTVGAAYIYEWTGQDWVYAAMLKPSDNEAFSFGYQVAISGDTIVVGAPSRSVPAANSGAAYVYVRTGASWRDEVSPVHEVTKLVANVPVPGEQLGYPVGIDGDVVVASACLTHSGAVYVFEKPPTGWGTNPVTTEVARLTSMNAQAGAQFGIAVDVQWNDAEGDIVVIGSWSENYGGMIASGAAYAVREPGTGWTSMGDLEPNLLSGAVSAGDFYGKDVSIDHTRVVVGAAHDDSVAGGVSGPGSVFVFDYNGSNWIQKHHLKVPAVNLGGFVHSGFGYATAISRTTIVVGSPTDDNAAGIDAGAAYIFSGIQ